MSNIVSFYLNNELVQVANPEPDLLLIDYLRSPEVSLSGAKKGCGQGGCGACTVILSEWDATTKKVKHRSINSCLKPVCSLEGLVITTVEGTGGANRLPPKNPIHLPAASRGGVPFGHEPSKQSAEVCQQAVLYRNAAEECGTSKQLTKVAKASLPLANLIDPKINPVAYRLAVNNGSQCGYCSTGFVMNMSAFLLNNAKPTKKEIEEAFDGNICRCTGYRPILTAMKTFAVDWTKEDEAHRMECLLDDQIQAQHVGDKVRVAFPKDAQSARTGISLENNKRQWLMPASIDELIAIYQRENFEDIYILNANTSFGIYTDDFLFKKVLVDISMLSALSGISQQSGILQVGAATTYTQFLSILDELIAKTKAPQNSALGALQFMAHRTAGTIVRNAATLAGNSMLVLKHIAVGSGEPFPSDLFTVLSALNAELTYVNLCDAQTATLPANELVQQIKQCPDLAHQILLIDYRIDLNNTSEIVLAQKVALRDINAHSIVNATSVFQLDKQLTIESVNLTFGAIAPYPWRAHKTEKKLAGTKLSLESYSSIAKLLRQEVEEALQQWAARMQGVEYEGFTSEYKIQLVLSFTYKALLNALVEISPKSVPAALRSSAEITWGNWPVSDGIQYYKNQDYKAPVSQPYIKLKALYQTSGQVRYTHEMEVPPTAVNASFVQSQRALASFVFKDPDTQSTPISIEELTKIVKRKYPALIRFITAKDVPIGGMNLQGMGSDQPIFASNQVHYIGQSIALAIAKDETNANLIAKFVSEHCLHYQKIDWPEKWQAPVLGLDDAIARKSIFPDAPESASFVTHIWKIIRNNSDLSWVSKKRKALDKSISTRPINLSGRPCTVVENSQTVGGQIHFYLETQACVTLPSEAGRFLMSPSSQSPMEMHQTAASVLGVEHNQVEVSVRQLGGAYGGKTEQAKFVIGASAIAAKTMAKPVRLVMPRDSDTSMIGKRHPYFGQCQIAIDNGEQNAADKGIIRGMDVNFYGDGGAFYDCSFIVSNCIQLRVDNAYRVENFQSTLDVYRTNTAPNTAFRSFGDIQGKLITENAIDDAAFSIGMDVDDVREKNLYQAGDVTPFGQALTYCYIREVWDYLKQVSDITRRKQSVKKFNQNNKWRKRGIYMLPVKYGSGYNLVQLEQASAVISVYSGDGTIIIHQGGVDMGQGMMTKVEQIASYILNIPMDMIQIQNAKTEIIPNPTSTGGSTGTAYNGLAVKQTCEKLRARLNEFGYQMLKEYGNDWCSEKGIDFWNYGTEGWAAKVPGKDILIWQNLITLAYQKRVNLIESFNAQIPGGTDGVPNMVYKPKDKQRAIPGIELSDAEIGGEVDAFCGFTYSAACAEVEVDILTGETKIIRADLMYDMGWSINPALDIGQVEGAFMQGVGYVTSEKLVFEPEGDEKGRLNSVNTWRYKPPAVTNVPLELNVHLFPRDKAANIPENPNELMSAKEVGEPPLVLAASVFFAIKAAVRASRVERGLDGLFTLESPATVQEVRRACEVDLI